MCPGQSGALISCCWSRPYPGRTSGDEIGIRKRLTEMSRAPPQRPLWESLYGPSWWSRSPRLPLLFFGRSQAGCGWPCIKNCIDDPPFPPPITWRVMPRNAFYTISVTKDRECSISWKGICRRLISAYPPRTRSTGLLEIRARPSATLPRNTRRIPRRPWVPMTIKSAGHRFASSSMRS